MEVTRKNFETILPAVEEAIKEASFLTIDTEFTGLNLEGLGHTGPFDTPEERYYKIVKGSSDFLILQFGLCAFSYNGNKKRYTAKPFNFYVFPRPYSRQSPDVRFLCQSSSLDFLISQGFDFNKVFGEGISYLTPAQESMMRESLQQKHEQFSAFSSPAFATPAAGNVDPGLTKGPIVIPSEHKQFIANVCSKIETFVDSSEDETMELSPCTAFQRKLIYQTVRTKFPSGVHLQTKTGEKRERCIVVTRVKGEEDLKDKEENRRAEEMTEVDAAVGFTKVIKMISQSGKLVIGHNMMLDVIHTIHQFMYPLPETYEDFKSMVHCVFPRLIDTKLMASTQPFKEKITSSVLGELRTTVESKPFSKPEVVIPDEFSTEYSTKEQLHEAGYDAYITGLCFISLTQYLGTFQDPNCERVPPTSPLMEPFINKLFMMRVWDIPYMNLAGPDLSPAREHVFHLTFPAEWKVSDIAQLFSPYGNVQIGWIDDTSAFVALYQKDGAASVLRSLKDKSSTYKIISYEDFKKGTSGDSTAPSRKRPISPTEEDNEVTTKKKKSLNVEAPPFESRLTPTTTPEKTEPPPLNMSREKNKSTEETKQKSSPDKSATEEKMFEEPAW